MSTISSLLGKFWIVWALEQSHFSLVYERMRQNHFVQRNKLWWWRKRKKRKLHSNQLNDFWLNWIILIARSRCIWARNWTVRKLDCFVRRIRPHRRWSLGEEVSGWSRRPCCTNPFLPVWNWVRNLHTILRNLAQLIKNSKYLNLDLEMLMSTGKSLGLLHLQKSQIYL